MFRRNRESITRRLSSSAFAITVPGKKRFTWLFVMVAALACGAAWAWMLQGEAPEAQMRNQVVLLQQEVERLQHDLKLGELRLQQEVATRESLAQQVDTQAQKLRQAQTELDFFHNQRERSVKKEP